MDTMRVRAVAFAAAAICEGATDWQQVADALLNNDNFGPWLQASPDPLQLATAVVREAENLLGKQIPESYSN